MADYSTFSQWGQLQADTPLSARTTLQVGGHAQWLFRPSDEQSLIQAMQMVSKDEFVFPIGRGSNLLIADQGIQGLVLDLSELNTLEMVGNQVTAGAGVRMSKLAQTVATSGLSGLQFMATVPGDLGGGVAMNAGAFGQQVSDTLESIRILAADGEVKVLNRAELDVQYRYTHLPKNALVLSATFNLDNDDRETIVDAMREMRKKRGATQPLGQPNCGSVFKNPEGLFAAQLIESVGLKGKQIGHANISDVHANFIVNQGGASCEDVLGLIRLARDTVLLEKNVRLEAEVRFVGCAL